MQQYKRDYSYTAVAMNWTEHKEHKTSALDGGWVVVTPRSLYHQERLGTHCIGGWVGPRAGLDGCGKSRPTWIRSPDRPACSESLYRLSYPGPSLYNIKVYIHTYYHFPKYCRFLLNHPIYT